MKTRYIFLIYFLTVSIVSNGQKEERNHFGINLSLATNNQFTYLEYERFIGKHISISPRVGFYKYKKDDEYGMQETGKGLGVGFSFRWHFGNKPIQGFFLGAGSDLFIYNYLGYVFWEAALALQLQAGYNIPLGKSMYLKPIIEFGDRTKLDVYDEEVETNTGFFRGGFTFGVRF